MFVVRMLVQFTDLRKKLSANFFYTKNERLKFFPQYTTILLYRLLKAKNDSTDAVYHVIVIKQEMQGTFQISDSQWEPQ